MTKEELQELRRKHERAQPAPWRNCGDLICSGESDAVIIIKRVDAEDVDLIVSMRNALGPLLDYIEELEKSA
jgi:nucleotide-binding universal stress UspA family protein